MTASEEIVTGVHQEVPSTAGSYRSDAPRHGARRKISSKEAALNVRLGYRLYGRRHGEVTLDEVERTVI